MVFVVRGRKVWRRVSINVHLLTPPMPKIEDDGNPRFVIFIRMANDEKEIQKTAIK